MSTGSESFGESSDEWASPRGREGGAGGDDDTFADVLNGFTFDSGRRRRKRKKEQETSAQPQASKHAADVEPEPTQEPGQPGQHAAEPGQPVGSTSGGLFDADDSEDLGPSPDFESMQLSAESADVRPYALTGGRTKANRTLELETLVSANQAVASLPEALAQVLEYRSIVQECVTPRSVAEIASSMRVPLGVARVLISDAADAELVTVHKTISGDDDSEAHLMLMERVLSGLRRL